MAFTLHQKVLFRHCDPAGIVFYPRYFEMINDCVEAFFDAELGHPFENLHKLGATPTVHIDTTFSAPSRHGDHLEIRLKCTHLGRSALDLNFQAMCRSEIRFTANSTLVYVNSDGQSAPWPDDLRHALEPKIESED